MTANLVFKFTFWSCLCFHDRRLRGMSSFQSMKTMLKFDVACNCLSSTARFIKVDFTQVWNLNFDLDTQLFDQNFIHSKKFGNRD